MHLESGLALVLISILDQKESIAQSLRTDEHLLSMEESFLRSEKRDDAMVWEFFELPLMSCSRFLDLLTRSFS